MSERIDKEIKQIHLRCLYKVVMDKIELQRRGHTEEQRTGHDLCKPFAVALCQGAAMHYLGRPSVVDGKEYVGVKDFDVWCFYKKTSENFLFGKQVSFLTYYCSKDFGKKKVDIMMRDINYKNSPIDSIQNWLATRKNDSPKYLSQKAVVLIYPKKHLGEAVWCEEKPC